MFGKDAGGTSESKVNSLLGNGSNCTGDIVVDGGLKIDGNFKGTIKAHSLFIGKNAQVEATIEVIVAVIGGKVLGDVIAEESLELQPKSELIGDVRTKNLMVAEAAKLEGRFDMGMSKAYSKRPKLDMSRREEHKPDSHGDAPHQQKAVVSSTVTGQTPTGKEPGKPVKPGEKQ